jgi:Na+/melibiose symporter-like transporter
VILLLVFGFICLFGFVIWQRLYSHPLLNPTVWRNRNFTACVLCVLFGYMSFITNQFWMSLYMQDVQKLGPLQIAVRLLPGAFAGMFWSFVGQTLVSRVNGTILMAIGSVAYVVSAILMLFIREHTSYWALLFPAMVISVAGAGF